MNYQILVRNSLIAIVLTVLFCIASYFWWDIPLANHLQNALSADAYHFFYRYMYLLYNPSMWAKISIMFFVLALILRYVLKWKMRSAPILFISGSILLGSVITAILKFFIGRARPEIWFSQQNYGFYFFKHDAVYNSMPSGHAMIAFSLFMALAVLCRRSKVLVGVCVLLALLGAISRLLCEQHFLSDIVAGAAIGSLSVYWMRAIVNCYTKKV